MTGFHRKYRMKDGRPLPRLWLMTDARVSDGALLRALARLPRGAGVVFRHYGLGPAARRALFDAVRAVARRRGLVLLLAGEGREAVGWGADGAHGRRPFGGKRKAGWLQSAPAHSLPEIRAAERSGADLVFLSPIFPTRSHPGGRTLGRMRFAMLARQARRPVIALGGMTAERARTLGAAGAYGWAAIDALSG